MAYVAQKRSPGKPREVEIHDVNFGAQGRPEEFCRGNCERMGVAPVLFCVRENFTSFSFFFLNRFVFLSLT
jgi:hypothetical protein